MRDCRALQADSHNPVLLSHRSIASVKLGRFTEALKDATPCVNAEPLLEKGYHIQGLAYAALWQPGLAEKATRQALTKMQAIVH
jgi:hypothetical protein